MARANAPSPRAAITYSGLSVTMCRHRPSHGSASAVRSHSRASVACNTSRRIPRRSTEVGAGFALAEPAIAAPRLTTADRHRNPRRPPPDEPPRDPPPRNPPPPPPQFRRPPPPELEKSPNASAAEVNMSNRLLLAPWIEPPPRSLKSCRSGKSNPPDPPSPRPEGDPLPLPGSTRVPPPYPPLRWRSH